MWYFSWILGLGLACTLGILNAMWYEFRDAEGHAKAAPDADRPAP